MDLSVILAVVVSLAALLGAMFWLAKRDARRQSGAFQESVDPDPDA